MCQSTEKSKVRFLSPVPPHLHIQAKPLAQLSGSACSRDCLHLLHWDHKAASKPTSSLLCGFLEKELHSLCFTQCLCSTTNQPNNKHLSYGTFSFNFVFFCLLKKKSFWLCTVVHTFILSTRDATANGFLRVGGQLGINRIPDQLGQ